MLKLSSVLIILHCFSRQICFIVVLRRIVFIYFLKIKTSTKDEGVNQAINSQSFYDKGFFFIFYFYFFIETLKRGSEMRCYYIRVKTLFFFSSKLHKYLVIFKQFLHIIFLKILLNMLICLIVYRRLRRTKNLSNLIFSYIILQVFYVPNFKNICSLCIIYVLKNCLRKLLLLLNIVSKFQLNKA